MPDEFPVDSPPWLRRISQALLWTLVRLFWKPKISGFEHLPRSGPVIIAANHVALIDGLLLIMLAGTARYTYGLAKAELFRIPFLGWYFRRSGIIPLNRKGDVAAMRASIDLLRRGACVGLFPEGTRNKTGLPMRPKAGVAFLAGYSGATVIPARFLGSDQFWRLRPFELRLAPGLKFAGNVENRDECLGFAQKVMDIIFSL
ncbi:MAG: hypothetical protein A3J74_07440 [Elusimicrobia bacterium RIFCSPHIGHO2_02_FULL_57_9]|nr:MAG: hypothetical protein A3J74_07440 [Elusimicrobia bacterium RIFCSPHIGHO2_02_FULL_57_9]